MLRDSLIESLLLSFMFILPLTSFHLLLLFSRHPCFILFEGHCFTIEFSTKGSGCKVLKEVDGEGEAIGFGKEGMW